MNNHSSSSVGRVDSADIAVPEHKIEVRFYSRILCTGEAPLWKEDLMNNLGTPIIGLGERTAEYDHLPLQWMPHIQVSDVASSAKSALKLGGSELMHGKDDDGNSQWAVLVDPYGAAFGIIPIVPAQAASSKGDAESPVGHISWIDLTVPNAQEARDFYSSVIGWSWEVCKKEDSNGFYDDYHMLDGDGKPAAGICHARGLHQDLPSVWTLHLPVGDLAESSRRAREEGGKVLKDAHGDDGKLAHVVVQDPVGAIMAILPG